MDKALILKGPGSFPRKPAVGAVCRTPFWIMNQKIYAPVHRAPIHPATHQTERDGRGMAHFCVFGALLFKHNWVLGTGYSVLDTFLIEY